MDEGYSICIPAYNEENTIGKLLGWCHENCKDTSNIIVCSDGSTDKTNQIISEFIETHKSLPATTFLQQERMGKTWAMNLITDNCKTDIMVFFDADIIPTRKAIDNILRYFRDKKVGCVCGYHIVMNKKKGWVNYLNHIIFNAKRNQDLWSSQNNRFFHVNGMVCAYRKSILPQVTYHGASQDAWVGWAISKKGYQVIYAHDVGIKFYSPSTFMDWKKSRKRTIIGRIRLNREHKVQKYFFSEIPFKHHVTTILKATPFGVRWYMALSVGVIFECLFRLRYYMCYNHYYRQYEGSKWEQITTTKKVVK